MHLVARLRTRILALLHLILFGAAYITAYAIRFEFDIPDRYLFMCLTTMPVAIGLKFAMFYVFGQYRSSFRYVSLEDIKRITSASALSVVLLIAAEKLFFPDVFVPRSILIIDGGLAIAFVSGVRILIRMAREHTWPVVIRDNFKKVFIAGAGDAGEGLLRELRGRPELQYLVVGFLDDDPAKRGMRIAGVPVLGSLDEALDLAEEYGVHEVIIAIPSATRDTMRAIVRKLREAGLSFKTLPSVGQIIGGKVDAQQIRAVTIEELLGRSPVEFDTERVAAFLNNKVVAVTGAAGSIGSELCRQTLRFSPAKLLLIDQFENGVFQIERELKEQPGETKLIRCVADVTDEVGIERLFAEHRPEVVFHAAAYKHVPLMEISARQAAKNNVFGTKVVADLSIIHGVEKFVLISTDKAVNPTSIMGMTKRLAELYIHALGQSRGAGLVAVRFGNVLGSSGSVVPIFKEQIEKGGPVTVTHPDMVRYFMTIPEAVQLVLEAGAIGKSGDVLVLDMGEPVRIIDLAKDLIELSGLREPGDIEIVFTGVRPGEKLREELCGEDEELVESVHEKVRIAKGVFPKIEDLLPRLTILEEAVHRGDEDSVRRLISDGSVLQDSRAERPPKQPAIPDMGHAQFPDPSSSGPDRRS